MKSGESVMPKLISMACSKAYGNQWGLSFVWDAPKTPINPEGTSGLADSFMQGWPLEKVADALRRLADSIDRAAANQTDPL